MPEHEQRVEPLLSVELGHERLELVRRTLVVPELDESDPSLEPDVATQRVVVGELEGS